ncbi:MAG TPA: cysteine--tRNA ligase [Acidimicrobiales bacterium]|jgi:L-cysteine:1D-myo-inositol 2-amino-2-deoxy-alpha-D-glucopyranoside ligase|nr:cysteine--tRNA ligase [Acidimicrobiales bacterium]MDP6213742.1 cysteine--tRNA ligase [Acidimicrobiales bacterium]HJL90508.1 cysteine--tRNA ligase [Acidimicrobiales bacterium]HJO99570.1 cysteine--tRNA ligase [Acidimicrobiales bacterium]|tara:strand:- start:2205 stop:3410 length:1206 start_codon:yes stop_codon:yes gene_type:complete
MTMHLFDTARGEVVSFEPGPTVTMYVCGITPYDATHLGHAFTYLTFDLVIRRLEDLGHEVHMVRNVTDVDDSILGKARELDVDYLELGATEVASFHEDLAALDLRPATAEPRATESIQSMLELIGGLEAAGHTYTVEGTTFFDVSTWEKFGSVSGYDEATMTAFAAERGANPDDPRLRNPLDFILWQASADDEPFWDSPFGPGRPGWHIECSAMAMAELGQTIDLHGGGDDLVFPHHECEATQSGAANGVPLAHHWMHVAMVAYEGIKMSKSLGNLVFIRNLRHLHDPRAIRLSLLGHHYRAGFEWFDHDIDDGVTRLDRLIAAAGRPTGPDPAPTLATIRDALDDDLNTAAARDALDMLAGAILAGAGDDTSSAFGLAEAAGLLGIRLDESVPESWVRTT